jgi:hypothetical protein
MENEYPLAKRWKLEQNDYDFEMNGRYFLSGLCARMGSKDDSYPRHVRPVRHGVTEIFVDEIPQHVSMTPTETCIIMLTSSVKLTSLLAYRI